jgi:signal transduction histidine kinase
VAEGERTLDHDLRSLVEQLPFDVWVRDREHRCLYANATCRARWPGLVGQLDVDGAPDADVAAIWRANNERALAGEIVRGEVRYRIDGVERTVVNILAPIRADATIRGTVGANIDVTEQRVAERKAEALGALLASLFAHAPIAIGVRALRGDDLVHVEDNPRAAAMFGTTPERLRDASERELGVNARLISATIARYRAAVATGEPQSFELSFRTPEGDRTFLGKLAPIPSGREGDEHFAIFGEDVTTQRSLQAGLLRADRLAALGTLAASIGHEIKNPAQYVLTYLTHAVEKLEESTRGLSSAGAEQVLADIRAAGEGVARIVTLVRDLGRLARPDPPNLEPIDVRAVLDSVLLLAGAHLRARARVSRFDAPELPKAKGDGVRLAQVLLNLLTNAVQAFGERRGNLLVRTTRVDGFVRLEIEDDGPGIADELRGRLFEPFVTSKSSSEGSGLGLYVSRQIVESMAGRIGIESGRAGGATAWVELPVAAEG